VEYMNGDDDSPGTRNRILGNKEFPGNEGPEKRGTKKGNAQPSKRLIVPERLSGSSSPLDQVGTPFS
jgi:hypothetical protein